MIASESNQRIIGYLIFQESPFLSQMDIVFPFLVSLQSKVQVIAIEDAIEVEDCRLIGNHGQDFVEWLLLAFGGGFC
jgi:hypothetical protein